MKPDLKKQVDLRLRRIAGQIAGIQRMVDEDRYCVDVLLQLAAVQAALDRAGKLMLGAHVDTCLASAIRSGKPREGRKKVNELMEIFTRFGHIRAR